VVKRERYFFGYAKLEQNGGDGMQKQAKGLSRGVWS
jgi:hypothetical protein